MSGVKQVPPDLLTAVPASWLDRLTETATAALLLFMPGALGVVAPWSEALVAAGALALALAVAGKLLFGRGPRPCWTWGLIPVLLFVGLATLQLLSLPAGWVARLSPAALATKRRLLLDLLTANPLLGRLTLSCYPPGTRHDLRIVLIAIVFFLTALVFYRRPAAIKRLLATMALIGGAYALLALLQDISGTDKIYWIIPTGLGHAASGPFILYNNYAQFMNLSIGAALGLLLVDLREFQDERREDPDRSPLRLSTWASMLWQAGFRRTPFLAATVICGLISLFLCLSRGGMVSALLAGTLACVLLARQRRAGAQVWIFVLLLTFAFAGLLYFGFDAVCDRLATLYNRPDPSSGRFQVYKDLTGVYARFWPSGTGLGTHQWVYPMFDRSSDPGLSERADSDWFQLAEEMGTIGLVLVALFCGTIWFHFSRAIRTTRPRVCLAAVGLGYSLLAVSLQSFTDFGQHLPAVAALTALTCGLLINLSKLAWTHRSAKHWERAIARGEDPPAVMADRFGWVPAPAMGLIAVLLVGGMAWTLQTANRARLAAEHWDRADAIAADLEEANWKAAPDQYLRLLSEASAASELAPDDVKYRYDLNCERWRAVLADATDAAGQVTWTPSRMQFVRRIVAEFHASRLLCPMYGPPLAMAGQLELEVLGDVNRGDADIQAAYALAPAHPTVCHATAIADALGGRWDEALVKYRRTLVLNPSIFQTVMAELVTQFHRPDLAIAVAKDKPEWLVSLALQFRQTPPPGVNPMAYAGVMESALRDLKARGLPDDAPSWELNEMSAVCERENDLVGATDYERRAIILEYGNVYFHLRLAQLWEQEGKTMEAVDEARICLRLQPQLQPARQMLGELALRPDFIPSE